MAQRIKYSVIVPIFNSEQTLSRCLESLVMQGRDDVQVVAVNDGSTDCSEKILLEFAAKHPIVDYVYQDNGGVSRARNRGLDRAKGEFVTFVDSDDYVSADYFSVLDQAQDDDLLVFAHENVGGPASDESKLFSELQNQQTAGQRLALLLSSRKIMSPCNKRFRRSIINEFALRFVESLSVGEDFNFCTAYAMQCRTIGVTEKKIIFIDISDQGSLSRRYRSHLDDKLVLVFQNVEKTISGNKLFAGQTPQLLAIVDYLYVKHVFSCVSEEFKHKKLRYFRDRRRIAEICEKFRQPISDDRCGIVHRTLRLALKWRVYFPFYFVSYLVKGRNYRK
ncbi:MAG: glycosyltransferase family 2 protein [Faecousia sp.]